MIGMVGVALGEAGVSISSMAVGPDQRTKTALMVLSTQIPRRRTSSIDFATRPASKIFTS